MRIQAEQGIVVVKIGRRFATTDAEHLRHVLVSLAPLSQLIVDFTNVRECQDVAFFGISEILGELGDVRLVLRGLTLHQSRLLKYLGVPLARCASA